MKIEQWFNRQNHFVRFFCFIFGVPIAVAFIAFWFFYMVNENMASPFVWYNQGITYLVWAMTLIAVAYFATKRGDK